MSHDFSVLVALWFVLLQEYEYVWQCSVCNETLYFVIAL
jgi:hypothetical protein